jgi:general nucleoside transport system permease protein
MQVRMLRHNWARSSDAPHWIRVGVPPLAALLVALVLLSLLLLAAGRDPLSTLWAILVGAFGSTRGLTETVTRMTPLLLCALAAGIPAKAGLFNIGGEGQLHCGAIAATAVVIYLPWLPHWTVIPSMILLAMLGGAFWGFIPGLLRGWLKVNEVLVSLMLNYVAIYLVEHLVHGPWKDPSALGWPYTVSFPEWAVLHTLGRSNIHLGLLFGLAAIALVYFLMRSTTWGFSVRVIEANPQTAYHAGIHVGSYVVVLMALGGAMAALAGLGEVSVIQSRLKTGISPGYGYTGFLVAWLARKNLIAIVPVSFLVGGLYSGADALQLLANLPSATVDIFMGLVFIAFIIDEYMRSRRRKEVYREEGLL